MKEKNRRSSQARLVASEGELKLLAPAIGTAPCVPAIKTEVDSWVKSGYAAPEGCTETSKALLNYWFHSDHRLANGRAFAYNTAQREAMETLVYLYEVAKIRRQRTMLEQYAVESKHLELLQHDDFARYCFKMATGSGKTKVIGSCSCMAVLQRHHGEHSRLFKNGAPDCSKRNRIRKTAIRLRRRQNIPCRPSHSSGVCEYLGS